MCHYLKVQFLFTEFIHNPDLYKMSVKLSDDKEKVLKLLPAHLSACLSYNMCCAWPKSLTATYANARLVNDVICVVIQLWVATAVCADKMYVCMKTHPFPLIAVLEHIIHNSMVKIFGFCFCSCLVM